VRRRVNTAIDRGLAERVAAMQAARAKLTAQTA
jgi:hypothetical protein